MEELEIIEETTEQIVNNVDLTITNDLLTSINTNLEYLININSQLLYTILVIVGSVCAVGVCYLLYKFFKIFF